MSLLPPRLAFTHRRTLLKALAGSGLLAAFERNFALAQSAPDYRALVCINMPGGNDGENLLIRFDAAGYQNYAAIRSPASGLNIPQAQLLPIQPSRGGNPFGFNPACAPLQQLFNQKRLAVIANMGMLAAPSFKADLESGVQPMPANLFSHPDQELEVQSADRFGYTRTGWGGRVADKLDAENPGTLFPALTSMGGLRPFVNGKTSIPLSVSDNPYLTLFSSNQFQFDALRDAALRESLSLRRDNVYQTVARLLSDEGLAASSVVYPILQNANSLVPPFFNGLNSSIANALKTVARMMEGRAQTQMRRQLFFYTGGGYDTHADQVNIQRQLMSDLCPAVKAFHDCLEALGLAQNVTTFTLSEFGRTFKPAANAGTDHGWGNYAFVVGGAVKGGDFYGTVPTQALNGPDDLGKDGRWIPTTSLEQYGATLCRWFGIAESDLPYVFPNIGAFANTNLGFMA